MKASSIFVLTLSLAAAGACGQVGKGAAARASRAAVQRTWSRTLARDAARDAATKPVALKQPRLVHRYVPSDVARRELRYGIPAGAHVTARARVGRPLSAARAQARYGLPQVPGARLSIQLPRSTRVQRNKVLHGEGAFDEFRLTDGAKSSQIRGAVTLKAP